MLVQQKKCFAMETKVIDFNSVKWDRAGETNRLWWEKRLDRPIIPIAFIKEQGDRPCPDVPILSQANWNDLSISPEAFIDRLDY
jgi:hypothetical protein